MVIRENELVSRKQKESPEVEKQKSSWFKNKLGFLKV